VLSPGSSPLKVLHISDLHMLPKQRPQSRRGLRELARFEPDLVVNTGDNLSHPKGRSRRPCRHLATCCRYPACFVFGKQTDYFRAAAEEPNELPDQSGASGCAANRCRGRTCRGGVHRARLAGHDAYPPRSRGRRPSDRGGRGSTTRICPGTATTPSPEHPAPARQSHAGAADTFARTAGGWIASRQTATSS